MTPNITNTFQSFTLDLEEEAKARSPGVYFWFYLQNKIAAVAVSAVEFSYTGKDLQTAVIEHERIKAQVEILQELLSELIPPTEGAESQQSGASHS